MSITPRVARKTNELREECKWVFVSITHDPDTAFKTQTQFKKALQCCGRNISLKKIDQYWDQYPDGIGYEEFCQIVGKENVISEAELLEAFQAIDINRDGFISFNELYSTLTKGERMTEDEVDDILRNADSNHDGKLNYKEFSRLVMNTIDRTKNSARKRMEQIMNDKDGKRSRDNSKGHSLTNLRDERSATKSPSLFANRDRNHRSPSDDDDDIRSVRSKASIKKGKSETRNNSDSDEGHTKHRKSHDLIEVKLQAPNKIESTFSEPRTVKKWFNHKIKGSFYLNDTSEHIISLSYVLDINEDTKAFFEFEPYVFNSIKDDNLVKTDMMLIVVKDGKVKNVCTLTENKLQNKWCAKCELSAGRYLLYPYTTGCRFKRQQANAMKPAKLFYRDSNDTVVLTDEFMEALNVIFKLSDLDSNGRLSKKEFHLYTSLSSNEDVDTEAWQLVDETVGLEKNELTREGFIELYKIEAYQDNVDIDEIWTRLMALGFNKNLQIDQACPFKITVSCERSDFKLTASEVYQLNKAEPYLHDFIIEQTQPIKLKSAKNVFLYEYHTTHIAAILIKNDRDDDSIDVDLNCEESENCVSNQNQNTKTNRLFSPCVHVRANKQKIGIFLMARNENKDWLLRCSPIVTSKN